MNDAPKIPPDENEELAHYDDAVIGKAFRFSAIAILLLAVGAASVYFWIRLGYHPLLRPEWPCAREGVAWLTREIRHSDKLSVSSDAGEPATPTVRTT